MADLDALLDRFPLNEEELQTLLTLYESYGSQDFLKDSSILDKLGELPSIVERAVEGVFVIGSDDPRDRFLEAVVSLMGRRGDRFLLDTVFDAARDGEETSASTKSLMNLLFRCMTLDDDTATEPSVGWSSALSSPSVTRPVWKEWAETQAIHVPRAVASAMSLAFLGRPNRQWTLPSTDGLTMEEAVALAAMGLGGKWLPVYNPNRDGLAFETLRERLLNYQGATLILIRTTEGDCIGYYSSVPWRSSSAWFTGDGECFLFRLSPVWTVYRMALAAEESPARRKFHQFLSPAVTGRRDSLKGLAIGGVAVDSPRLWVTESLEQCRASPMDQVFGIGPLLSSDDLFFDVDQINVWAVRTSQADYQKNLSAGQTQAEFRNGIRQRLAKVDKAQFLDDFKSGAVVNHLFDHRDQARGRADFVADDDEAKGYYIEDKVPSPRPTLSKGFREEGHNGNGHL